MKTRKKTLIKKLVQEKKNKKIRIKFDRKKPEEDEI
jgi:hypothetical protein